MKIKPIDIEKIKSMYTPNGFKSIQDTPIQQQRKTETIPESQIGSKTQSIPIWIKNNAKWESEGSITDVNFIKGIEFLAEHGIIKIKS